MCKDIVLVVILGVSFDALYCEQHVECNRIVDYVACVQSEEDSFFAEWSALSQENVDNDEDDVTDNLINALAVEKNEHAYKSFLYAYLAPYCLKMFLLYGKIKESAQSCLKKLFTVKKEL